MILAHRPAPCCSQRRLVPDDRRHEEQQLHEAEQQRADVAVAGGQDAEAQCHPDAVEHDQAERRDEGQVGPRPRLRKDDRDDDEDDDVVREQDHLPPHQPVDVHRQRRRQLLDQTLVGDEHVGALEDGRVDQIPDDQPERDVGQVLGQLAA